MQLAPFRSADDTSLAGRGGCLNLIFWGLFAMFVVIPVGNGIAIFIQARFQHVLLVLRGGVLTYLRSITYS